MHSYIYYKYVGNFFRNYPKRRFSSFLPPSVVEIHHYISAHPLTAGHRPLLYHMKYNKDLKIQRCMLGFEPQPPV